MRPPARPLLALPAKWPSWQRRRAALAFAIFDAGQGDMTPLSALVRSQPIPRQYRAEVAELLSAAPRRRRGVRSRLRSGDVFRILGVHHVMCTQWKLPREAIVRHLATRYSTSKGTIGDVLTARKTFEWVKRDLSPMLRFASVEPRLASSRVYRSGEFAPNFRRR
jgi:hypothetical protein